MTHRNNSQDRIVSIEPGLDPVNLLRREVQQVLESKESAESDWSVIRLCVRLNHVDPLEWLKVQTTKTKAYWKGRSALESIAAVGCADEICGEEHDFSQLGKFEYRFQNAGEARYFGGIRFDTRIRPSDEWSAFSTYRFFLPRFELVSAAESTLLFCNLILPRDRNNKRKILNDVSRLKLPPHRLKVEEDVPLSRFDQPEKQDWDRIISTVIDKLEDHSELAKVVVARKVTFELNDKVDCISLFGKLTKITQHHFQFFYQFGSDTVFMGASPERLYKRDGRYIESEAIAGTGLRAMDGRDDLRFADALLGSEKDQREHAFVRDGILESMTGLCNTMQIDSKPSVLNLSMGRHLRSKFWGMLKDNSTDFDILETLHPTSAVGGYPTLPAMNTIKEVEPFDRGWYAGPVGWIGKNSAEFSVAIRSALASEKRISLFSGAGIVRGSTPDNEWLEVEQKNSDFLKVLGLDQRRSKY